jgi:SAM-dependent methyltransferase
MAADARRVQLACARCRGALAASGDELACGGCGARYPVVAGVPVLSGLAGDDPATAYKRRQVEFFDGEAEEFEIARPQRQPRLYGWLMTEKFRRSVRGVESRLAGATVLTVCGGSGMDAEFLARRGAAVIASDLSLGAARRACERGRRCGLAIDAVVADAEHLPFADRSVGIVYVHDGLHHLRDPMVGLAEMCRVARDCVLVTEPSRAAVTAIAVRLGIALEEEDAGNRVERVSTEQIAACLAEHGLDVVGVDRYAMYYRHEPGRWMRFFSRRRSFPLARRAIVAFNLVLGSAGNKLSVRAMRAIT